jgi:hypothetical protein
MAPIIEDADASPCRRFAILAGVREYYYGSPALPYAESDCKKFGDALCSGQRLGFTSDNMLVLLGSDTRPGHRPNRSMLLTGIWKDLAGAKIDLLVLFLAMHGVEHDGRTYLVPQDGIVGHPETLIPLAALLEKMAGVDARQRLVVFDGCHGGGIRQSGPLPASFASEIGAIPDITVLSACDIGEASHESDALRGGVFTHYFSRALRRQHIDTNNQLPLSRVYERAERQTNAWAHQHGVKQSPRDFANRRTTINLFPPSGDVIPLKRYIRGKKQRTRCIIRVLRHLLQYHRTRIGLGPFCLRIRARLSSFAIADDEAWRRLDPKYFRLVKEERELLMDLVAAGAHVKLILSWTAEDVMTFKKAEFKKVDLKRRLIRLQAFFAGVLSDPLRTACFSVVRTTTHGQNLLFLDDLYMIEGRRVDGTEGGMDFTETIQEPKAVRTEIGFFDVAFRAAFEKLCRDEGRDPLKTDNAALLTSALNEIQAGLRILENEPPCGSDLGSSGPGAPKRRDR